MKLSDLHNYKVIGTVPPEYQPAPTPPPSDPLRTAAGFTDALFGGGKVGEAIGSQKVKSDVLAGKHDGVQPDYAAITPETRARLQSKGIPASLEEQRSRVAGQVTMPTAGQIAGSTLQAAALFTPVGKLAGGLTAGARAVGISKGASAIGKIGAGALAGGAFDVALNLQEGKTGADVLSPGLGTAIGAAIPGIGVAKNVVGRFGHDQAPRIINSLIKPLQKDFSYGKNPGRAIAESGIVANNFDDLVAKIQGARQTTGQEIGALGRKLSTKPVVSLVDSLSPLDDAMRTAASQNNPTLLSRLANVKKAITTVMEPAVDDAGQITIKEVGARQLHGLTFTEARDILRQIGDITQFTGNPSDDKIVNAALKHVYGEIKEQTLNAADNANPELAADFRKLTEKYADLSSAEIAAKYRDKILERSSLIGFSPQVAGMGTAIITLVATGGAAVPAVLAGITGAVLDKLAMSPAFKTRLASLLANKSSQEISVIYQKLPALQKLFPKGSPISPGDYLLETEAGKKVSASVGQSIRNAPGLSMRDITRYDASGRPIANGDSADALRNNAKWPTTASKPSTAGNTSTGSALTERGGVSAPKADTSVPFDGEVFYHGTTAGGAKNINKSGFVVTKDGTNASNGVSLSSEFEVSQSFAKNKGKPGGSVFKVQLDPTAKLVSSEEWRNYRNIVAEKLPEKRGGSISDNMNAKFEQASKMTNDHFKTEGYSGIDFRGDSVSGVKGAEFEIRVWDTNKLKKVEETSFEKVGNASSPSIPKGADTSVPFDQVSPAEFRKLLNDKNANYYENKSVGGKRPAGFGNKTRAYGDYLYAQDRDMFNDQLRRFNEGDKELRAALQPSVRSLPPELAPLAAEARKYKTAEEFVKAQGEVLYSGSKVKYDQFDLNKADKGGLYGNSAYMTADAKRASSYGDNVTEYVIPKTAKLLKEADFERRVNSIISTVPYRDIIVARAKAVEQFIKEGYDGVKTKDTTAIFNSSALQTKSQLTDFYNKVNESNASSPRTGAPKTQ